jgi:predicted aminopeptidase
MLPTKLWFIWPNGFRGEESKKSANQKQESPVVAMFVTDRDRMSKLYRGPSIDASYQVSDHLAKQFQRKRFLEIDQSETRIACGGHFC